MTMPRTGNRIFMSIQFRASGLHSCLADETGGSND